MKLTRGKRILLELFGPGCLGLAISFITGLGLNVWKEGWKIATGGAYWKDLSQMFQELGLLLLFAYIACGIQSILYTSIMEWRFARGLDPRSWASVGLSSLLGFASGAAICLAYGFGRSDTLFLWLYIGGIGLVVGLLLGVLIKRWSIASAPEDRAAQ